MGSTPRKRRSIRIRLEFDVLRVSGIPLVAAQGTTGAGSKDMTCINCKAGNLHKRISPVPIEIKREMFSVETHALVCDNCGYTTIEGARMAEYMRLGADAYRVKHGRLTSSEIRLRRSRLQMNQVEFAKYLGVSSISVKRWELGKVQDDAMDFLIRMRTDPSTSKS